MSYTCGTGSWSGPLPGDPSTNSILTATPVFGGIDVTWTPAIVNPHAVAYTYLYRSTNPDFLTAVPIATVGGTHFYDKLENLLTYYYWIQILSINGTLGEVIGPASAIPRLSIDATIEALTGRIDNGVLAQSLKSEIDRISLIDGDLFQEIQDRIAANELLGAAIQAAQTDASQAVSMLNEEITQRITAYNVLLQTLNTMAGQVNDNKAAIETETTLRISNDEALAQQITNVQSAAEDDLAAVQTTLQTNINTVNGKVTDIGALYTAKVQVNGLIGGFGVYNDGTEVQAGFDVDTFWVGRTGPDKKKPFIIDSDTGETYIDKAVIPTLTADMIDTRGLSIKDANGNIILAAGTALDWSRIGGVNRPEDGATVGASVATSFSTWDLVGQSLVSVSDGKVGSSALRLSAGGGYPTQTSFVPIDPTKKYRVRFWARPSSDCNGWLFFSLRQAINETGTWGPVNGGRAPYKPSYQSRAGHNATYGTDAWGEYSYIWSAADWQAGVKFFRPEFLDNRGTAGYWEVQGLVIEEATDVEAAKDAATSAQQDADAANAALADIASDSKLTPAEKKITKKEWDGIVAEKASINAQATALGVTTENTNYNNAYDTLDTYITPLLASLTTASDIVGSTFRSTFSSFYTARQALLNKISAEAAKRADWSSVRSRPDDPHNLCIKSSFEDGEKGAWVGSVSVEVANTPWSSKALLTQGRDAFLDDWFSVTPGEKIEVEAALLALHSNHTLRVGIHVVDKLGANITWLGALSSEPGEAWAIKAGTITIPANASKARCWVQMGGYSGFGYGYVTNLRYRRFTQITPSNVSTYIADAALGNAQIGGNLWSTNWNYAGGTGWLLDRSGNFYGNNIYARGDIEASSLKANTAMVQTLNIAGNAVIVPTYVEYPSAAAYNVYQSGTETEWTLLSDVVTVNVDCSALIFIGCNDSITSTVHTLSAGAGGRGHYNWPAGTEWASIRLYLNGSLVKRLAQWNVSSTVKGAGKHIGTYYAMEKDCVFIDTLVVEVPLVAGTNTIDIRCWVKMADGDGGARRNSNAYMLILGAQR